MCESLKPWSCLYENNSQTIAIKERDPGHEALINVNGSQYVTAGMWTYATTANAKANQPRTVANVIHTAALNGQSNSWMNISDTALKKMNSGKISPAAYSHVMDVMYKWYLAPEKNRKSERDSLLAEVNAFIQSGYKQS